MTNREFKEKELRKALYKRIQELSKSANPDKMYQILKYRWGFTKNPPLFREYIQFISQNQHKIICVDCDKGVVAWEFVENNTNLVKTIKDSTIFLNEDWLEDNLKHYN